MFHRVATMEHCKILICCNKNVSWNTQKNKTRSVIHLFFSARCMKHFEIIFLALQIKTVHDEIFQTHGMQKYYIECGQKYCTGAPRF